MRTVVRGRLDRVKFKRKLRARIEAGDLIRVLTHGTPRIAVLGDSYTAGFGLDSPLADSWAALLGKSMGAEVVTSAVGGTGFAATGLLPRMTFADRLDDLLATNPDIVIVQGGQNDTAYPQAPRAAGELFARIAMPLIVVGPAAPPRLVAPAGLALELRAEAERSGATFVDLAALPLTFQRDGLHADGPAHAIIRDAVTEALPAQRAEQA